LELCTRILEGRLVKYVTGTGATPATRNRLLMYKKLAEIHEQDLSHYHELLKIVEGLNPATFESLIVRTGGGELQECDGGEVQVVGDDMSIIINSARNEISVSRSLDIYDDDPYFDLLEILGNFDNDLSLTHTLSIGCDGRKVETKSLMKGSPVFEAAEDFNQLSRRPSYVTSQRLILDRRNSISIGRTATKVPLC